MHAYVQFDMKATTKATCMNEIPDDVNSILNDQQTQATESVISIDNGNSLTQN